MCYVVVGFSLTSLLSQTVLSTRAHHSNLFQRSFPLYSSVIVVSHTVHAMVFDLIIMWFEVVAYFPVFLHVPWCAINPVGLPGVLVFFRLCLISLVFLDSAFAPVGFVDWTDYLFLTLICFEIREAALKLGVSQTLVEVSASQHANYQPVYSATSVFKPALFISLSPGSQMASLKPAFPLASTKLVVAPESASN